jgi:hypothetical protein
MPINMLSVIEEHLRSTGMDGLVNGDQECCCELGSLAPCDGSCLECSPGKRCNQKCEDCEDHERCETEGYDYLMLEEEEHARRYGVDPVKPAAAE